MSSHSMNPDAPPPGDFFEVDSDNEAGSHEWEQKIQKTWDVAKEDAKGELRSNARNEQRVLKKALQKELKTQSVVEKGVVRYMYVIIDMSVAMNVRDDDLRTSRREATFDLLHVFVQDFFDQNPISQLGFIIGSNKKAEKISSLSGNRDLQQARLHSRRDHLGEGEISIQNCLTLAIRSLSQIPAYGAREVLLITSSLATVDAGDIMATLELLKKNRVRTSVISLSAELYIAKRIADETGGTFSTAMNKENFLHLLRSHIPPVPSDPEHRVQREWIQMGFPHSQSTTQIPALCVCHRVLKMGGHSCPRCLSKYCSLPMDCQICGLTLISAPILARSYHHLRPVPSFKEADPILIDSFIDSTGFYNPVSGGVVMKRVVILAPIINKNCNQNDLKILFDLAAHHQIPPYSSDLVLQAQETKALLAAENIANGLKKINVKRKQPSSNSSSSTQPALATASRPSGGSGNGEGGVRERFPEPVFVHGEQPSGKDKSSKKDKSTDKSSSKITEESITMSAATLQEVLQLHLAHPQQQAPGSPDTPVPYAQIKLERLFSSDLFDQARAAMAGLSPPSSNPVAPPILLSSSSSSSSSSVVNVDNTPIPQSIDNIPQTHVFLVKSLVSKILQPFMEDDSCKRFVEKAKHNPWIAAVTVLTRPHVYRLRLYTLEPEVSATTVLLAQCTGCQAPLLAQRDLWLQCPTCTSIFCLDCDVFVHQFLHNCPACAN